LDKNGGNKERRGGAVLILAWIYFLQFPNQIGKVFLGDLPNNIQFYRVVFMDDLITRAFHGLPRQVVVFLLRFRGNPVGGFSYDLKTPYNGVLQEFVF
jgi:hypothetical protein